MSYSGFVIPESGVLFTTKPETFNYETTIESIRAFLTANPVPEGKKYAIVMDNVIIPRYQPMGCCAFSTCYTLFDTV